MFNLPRLYIFLSNGLVMAINYLYRGSIYSQGAQQREIARVISVSVGFGLRGLEDIVVGGPHAEDGHVLASVTLFTIQFTQHMHRSCHAQVS